jgi:hypothetical protein
MSERTGNVPVLLHIVIWRSAMSKLGILGATALSLTLAVATPAFAGGRGGGGWGGGMHGGGGGMHVGGGGGGMHFGGGGAAFHGAAASPGFASPAFRGAQASMGPAPVARSNFVGTNGAQFAQGGWHGGWHGDRGHGRHFGRGIGFVAGLAAGSALGYGYSDPAYYDDYAYNDYYDSGYPDGYVVSSPGYVVSGGVADPAYCAQRYKSYDPASGTYLGYDGLRHPCQ